MLDEQRLRDLAIIGLTVEKDRIEQELSELRPGNDDTVHASSPVTKQGRNSPEQRARQSKAMKLIWRQRRAEKQATR